MATDVYRTELNSLVEAFFANLRRRNKAPKTLERWRPELRRFVEWAGERRVDEIALRDLDEFLVAWETGFVERNGRPPAPNSMRAVMQALKSFYVFADKREYLVDEDGGRLRNPALQLDLPVIRQQADLDWLGAEEDEMVLDSPMSEREMILVYFLRMTGLRLNEALTLTNRDVDLVGNSVLVRDSKTDAGFRLVPISPELRPRIQRWLEFTRHQGWYHANGPFLVTRNRSAMKAQYVETAIARVGVRAGLSRRLKPHTLRRTFGSHLLNRGARLEVVSKLLGHASTAITEKAYARLEDKTVREEMFKALLG